MPVPPGRDDAATAVVTPRGRLDITSSGGFAEQVQQLIDRGARWIVVDLDLVTFMDSAGVGSILRSLKRAREHDGELRIARPPRQALMVLERTALTRVLHPYPTVEEALATG